MGHISQHQCRLAAADTDLGQAAAILWSSWISESEGTILAALKLSFSQTRHRGLPRTSDSSVPRVQESGSASGIQGWLFPSCDQRIYDPGGRYSQGGRHRQLKCLWLSV